MVLGILSVLALVVIPRVLARTEPDARLLQRLLWEAADRAGEFRVVRLSVESGRITAAISAGGESGKEEEWRPLSMQWIPEGADWRAEPASCYVAPDGSASPWRIERGQDREKTSWLVAVTGLVLQEGNTGKN